VKVLQVYNQYRSPFNGENAVVEWTVELLRRQGCQADLWTRSSRDIEPTWKGKMRAFCSGIYSRSASDAMSKHLQANRPDVVHVHNLYPLFSPSILVACRRQNVPVVMTVHNQQFACPKSDQLRRGRICERCSGGREYHCVLLNCRANIFESTGYAIRSMVARRMRLFYDNVTRVIALSDFSRQRLRDAGFAHDRIVVLPNTAPSIDDAVDPACGEYAAFAGRLSAEKGIDTLLAAAASLDEIPVRIAGSGPLADELESRVVMNAIPTGYLEGEGLRKFYRRARFLVMPSTTYEMCPMVILEAMSHGLPVIASRLGGQAELVEHGVTGLLFRVGDARDLADKMRQLWNDPQLCRRLGAASRRKVQREHNENLYFRRLLGVYREAIAECSAKSTTVVHQPPTWSTEAES